MALTVTTDPDEITAVLDRFLATDPVSGTVLGTIRGSLEADCWCAVDGDRLAVRSGAAYPVLVMGAWSARETAELATLLGDLPSVRGLSGPPDVAVALAEQVRPGTRPGMGQRLFRCDDLVAPTDVAGSAAVADPGDVLQRGLVQDWYVAFVAEAGDHFGDARQAADRALAGGTVWLWLDVDGAPVSLAAAREAVAGSARVGPVYTPVEHRGNGYGSAVTAAATRSILDAGAVPVLFTDLANPTSNKIYQEIGYTPVEDRLVVAF